MKLNTIIFTIIASLLLVGCANRGTSLVPSSSSGESSLLHEHTFDTTYSYDDKYHFFKSTCGHDVIDKKEEHNFKETKVESTYESEGYTLYSCNVCAYSYLVDLVNKLEHNYSKEWKFNETHHYKECIDEGYADLIVFEEAHKYKEEIIAPTYEEEGYTLHSCEVCSYFFKDTYIEKLEHEYSNLFSFDNDYHWKQCIDKGYEDLFIDKEKHDYQTSVVEPTFDSKGYTLHQCKKCDHSYKDNETEPLKKTYKVTLITYGGYGVKDIEADVGEKIYLPTPEKEGYAFVGWYKEVILTNEIKSLDMKDEDITVYAKWIKTHEIFNRDTYKYIYLGRYPQTLVCNDKLIQELDKIETKNSSGYYVYDGIEYAKKTAVESRYCNNSYRIKKGQPYYFTVEPILWRILTSTFTNTYTLLSEKTLRSSIFDSISNNYANSYIRRFINGELYNEAFNEIEKEKIMTTLVDNSAPTTNANPNKFACEDTYDKVFLLSYRDYRNKSYGFLDDDMNDEARYCPTSDYALADGLSLDSSTKSVNYWTRSPIGYQMPEYDSASYIQYTSWTNTSSIISNYGVRVGINIEL